MARQDLSEQVTRSATTSGENNELMKVAVAVALARSKLLHKQPDTPPYSDALKWKQKAKERKQEILRLKEELKEAYDASRWDLYPESAACKCYFFDKLGELRSDHVQADSDQRFNVLRRRFLREVRFNERKRKSDGSCPQRVFSDLNVDGEIEQLRASVNFLVEMCSTRNHMEAANFANLSHQAVDFILASLRNLLSVGENIDIIEGIVNSLIMRLVRNICPASYGDTGHFDMGAQFYIQHLIRKLGSEHYIGQRAILSLSQRIAVVAEKMLYMDPFDDAFPSMHTCLFIMIRLIEFLVSDYMLSWSNDEGFDNVLFEEWVTSLSQARKGLELLENRNTLYVLYMDRVMGLLAKQVGQIPSWQQPNNRNILDTLLG